MAIKKKHFHHNWKEDLTRFFPVINGLSSRLVSDSGDRQVFIAIQIERYLKRKTLKRFCSEVEKDAILDIITEYWNHMEEELNLRSEKESKIDLFYHCIIVFPYFVAEEETIIPVDFKRKSVLSWEDNCPCGSGIPYYKCCGRTEIPVNSKNGPF